MPRKYPAEVHDRAVRMALDRLGEYPSVWAACRALAPKLGVGAETLRKWIVQAQIDAGSRTGPSSEELAEISRLRRERLLADSGEPAHARIECALLPASGRDAVWPRQFARLSTSATASGRRRR